MGGYGFDVEPARLTLSWWLTIGTGVALAVVETGLRLLWFHQVRGLMMLVKLSLVLAVPLASDSALLLLVAAVVLASVSSHMPARYRYYSVIYREVIPDAAGAGTRKLLGGSNED